MKLLSSKPRESEEAFKSLFFLARFWQTNKPISIGFTAISRPPWNCITNHALHTVDEIGRLTKKCKQFVTSTESTLPTLKLSTNKSYIHLLGIAWSEKTCWFLILLLILQLLPRMILFSYWLKSKRPQKHCGRGACRKGKSLPLLQKFGNCFSLPAAFKLESGIHVLLFTWNAVTHSVTRGPLGSFASQTQCL